MTRWTHAMTVAALLAAAVTMALPAPAGAQDNEAALGDAKGKVILTWEEFVKITGYDPSKPDDQMLTIPWADVQKLLGDAAPKLDQQPAATLKLSWKEFEALLKWSIERAKPEETPPPPADYIVTASRYTGTLRDDGAELTMHVTVNVLKEKGWKRIPLLPSSVALTETQFKPAEGVFLHSHGSQYELLTQKTGAIEATLSFSVAVEEQAGIQRVSFPRVAAGSSRLELTLAREDVDVKVAAAQSMRTEPGDGKTTKIVAAIPAGPPVTVSWERALAKVEKVPPKLHAETRTLVAVADGLLLCQEAINFNILHTPVRELTLRVPAGVSVLTVSGPSVQDWRVKDEQITVQLRGEAIGAYGLRVQYEAPTANGTAAAPVLRTVGTESERGYVGVMAVASVELGAGQVEGATLIDPRRLPPDLVAMTNQPILLAFRYVQPAFSAAVTIKKHEEVGVLVTVVDSALYTAMQLNDGRRITKALYTVRNNRNQFLRMQMPAGQDLWSVAVDGKPASPARDEKGRVLIPLIRSAAGGQMRSFPVEIVYVEKPEGKIASRGSLRVELPVATVPIMHVMYNYYAPAEGEYTMGWGKPGFSGPLRVVEKFSQLSSGPGAEVVQRDVAGQAAQLEQQVQQRADEQARRRGAAPVRVRLPIQGKRFKLEKLLALGGESVFFTVHYRNWNVPE